MIQLYNLKVNNKKMSTGLIVALCAITILLSLILCELGEINKKLK
jgi:hypothetical protein